MIDFKKRLVSTPVQKPVDPIALYETLDRASDKGPLRPAQDAILKSWHADRRSEKDIILKLHTGQGKTLIGLLMLQSKMNECAGPAVYLCPNNFLIEQTCAQATQFGIKYCIARDGDLPSEFLDGTSILITSVQKMFNGRTKFHLGSHSLKVDYIVMDDAHACVDSIRDAFLVHLSKDTSAYQRLIELFSEALRKQGAGTFSDIEAGEFDAILPVPYWEWQEKQTETLEILSAAVREDEKQTEKTGLWFVWPLVKNSLKDCQCVVSGRSLEISPYLPQLEQFRSFWNAKCRVFMSATVSNDAFLIRGLRLPLSALTNPLVYSQERWSGEKMILIPSLIHEELDRSRIVNYLGQRVPNRRHGVVGLCPSVKRTIDWGNCGSVVATRDTLRGEVERLRSGEYDAPLIIVNRYDGIDLPDGMCRILVLDSKPYSENLADLYEEDCRATSDITSMRLARVIEQGLGRSVRGEKDYCAIVLIGAELVRFVRSPQAREYLSRQTRGQIEIGLEIAEVAAEDILNGTAPLQSLQNLISQCLKRDVGWKEFYVERMNAISIGCSSTKAFSVFKKELDAELHYRGGNYEEAKKTLQSIIDNDVTEDCDRYWYLQEMARMTFPMSKSESDTYQLDAYRGNMNLMQTRNGIKYEQLLVVGQKRAERIIMWLRAKSDHEQLRLDVNEMLSNLEFGVKADKFEKAFRELGVALGYSSERPDKEWKKGPDNLWCVASGEYLLVECKNEADPHRTEINKHESGQMNNSLAWFKKHYNGATSTNIMIIPAKKLNSAAGFSDKVSIMTNTMLRRFRLSIKGFFDEFAAFELNDLSEKKVHELLITHDLTTDKILSSYAVDPV